MKKITILALHLGYGGIEKYISDLCKMLEDDFKIEIISTYKVLDKPAFHFSKKVKIKYLINDKPNKTEMKEALQNFKLITFFKYLIKNSILLNQKKKLNIQAIKKLDTDIIITTRTFHNSLVGKYIKKDIIKIATEHNYHNNNQKYINNLIKSIKNFNYFILVSKELELFYKEKVDNIQCLYIPNIIEKLYNDPKYNHNHNLVSIGRLSKEKGFEDLIDIISIIQKEIPDIKLNLIGDGVLKDSLTNKIDSLNLKNNIKMYGFLNQEEIKKILLDSSIYVMTSYSESFGIVLIEAMSYGLPCVAFDTSSGARQIIENKRLLIKDRNKREISNLIMEIFNSAEKCQQYGMENYEKCQKYLIDNVKKEWLNLLKGSNL